MNNPEEILGTSKSYYPLFFLSHRRHLLFCGISELIHVDFFKHQTSRNETLGVVITYVIIIGWKNNLWSQFSMFLMRISIRC